MKKWINEWMKERTQKGVRIEWDLNLHLQFLQTIKKPENAYIF
jgi:hypothetical protein